MEDELEDEKRQLQRTQEGELDQLKREFQRKKQTLKDQHEEQVHCRVVVYAAIFSSVSISSVHGKK